MYAKEVWTSLKGSFLCMNWKLPPLSKVSNIRTTISITIKKNDYLCRTLGRNMTEGLAVLIIANVANAMKTIKAMTANKGKC